MMIATLTCDPVYSHWLNIAEVNIQHGMIIPGASYVVEVINEGCSLESAINYSPPLTIINPRWGDLVKDCTTTPCGPPDGSVDVVADVTAGLDKFRNLVRGPASTRTDVEPSVIDHMINISDVTFVLDAFGGDLYPFEPSTSIACP